MSTNVDVQAAFQALRTAKADFLAALRARGPEPVKDWSLTDADGAPVQLSALFGEHDDLLVVHNMGRGCSYCTLWADGFRGIADHLAQRCSFVLCSHDPPDVLRGFVAERGWNFRCVSGAGSGFTAAMGYASPENTKPMPGVSSFQRRAGGEIVRIAHTPFGPGDDFCAVWPLFDLLADGAADFKPR
ncbi:MAG: DUF899 family protein [Phycisphaerales bacterium]